MDTYLQMDTHLISMRLLIYTKMSQSKFIKKAVFKRKFKTKSVQIKRIENFKVLIVEMITSNQTKEWD
jgi:hypothetical protein